MARPKLQLVFTDVDDRYEPMSLLGTRLYENRVPIDGLVNPHPELTSPIAMSRYRLSYLAASLSYRNPDSAIGARYLVLEHDPGLGAATTWPSPQLDPTQRSAEGLTRTPITPTREIRIDFVPTRERCARHGPFDSVGSTLQCDTMLTTVGRPATLTRSSSLREASSTRRTLHLGMSKQSLCGNSKHAG
ncbi:hypothetical protein FSOLCH5_007472 [Fusarium solani]